MKPTSPIGHPHPPGLPPKKPTSQFRLKSMLNVSKENPIPLGKQPMEGAHKSALKINIAVPKAKWTNQTNFKG